MDLVANSSIYNKVLEAVYKKSKEIFEENGIDEHINSEFRSRWESKYQRLHPGDYSPHMPQSQRTLLNSQNQQRIAKFNELTEFSGSKRNNSSINIEPSSKKPKNIPGQFDGATLEFIDPEDRDYEENKQNQNEIENVNNDITNIDGDNSQSSITLKENETAIVLAEDKADEEDPDCVLDSEDDLNESEDDEDGFEAEHFAVCQYDKVARSKAKWNIHLKNGIITVDGREFCFCKASGVLEW